MSWSGSNLELQLFLAAWGRYVKFNLRKFHCRIKFYPTELNNRSGDVSSPSHQLMMCFYLSFVYWICLMFRGWTLAAVNIIHSKVHKIYPYYPLDKCDFQLGYLGADIKMPMTCILPVCECTILRHFFTRVVL